MRTLSPAAGTPAGLQSAAVPQLPDFGLEVVPPPVHVLVAITPGYAAIPCDVSGAAKFFPTLVISSSQPPPRAGEPTGPVAAAMFALVARASALTKADPLSPWPAAQIQSAILPPL